MSDNTSLKYVALYLPQFHTIPENDQWWGKGFTEWTNTSVAEPLFDDHYQPHEPHDDIGCYDLSDVEVMIKQAQMAKEYGLHGFCYYYYWFNGKTLLEKPLQNMLKTPEVDLPFCLCWANHNWTRSWDAGNKEMLLEQTYDDNTHAQFIDDLFPYFNDKRYIRIDNKPVLLVYQADLIKNPCETVEKWRQYAKIKYGIDLYLIHVQQNNLNAPAKFGYDAAVEFAPNYVAGQTAVPQAKQPKLASDINLTFYDYLSNAFQYILRPQEDYKLFRCVYPMWDNTARRKKKGGWMFLNSSLENFKNFLIEMSKVTLRNFKPNERFLFINAWNEWAEGTHLEPCKKYGYQLLDICRDVSQMPDKQLLDSGFSPKTHQQMRKQVRHHHIRLKHRIMLKIYKFLEKKLRNKKII